MSGRNDGNKKSRGENDLPAAQPSRLDQFADEMFGDEDKGYDEDITSRKEKQTWLK